jgi:ankyrin repeat protein
MDAAFREAVESGHLHEVQELLAAGVDVNAADHGTGLTPLHAAAGAGQLVMLDLLLARGADVNAADAQGQTALFLAAKAG